MPCPESAGPHLLRAQRHQGRRSRDSSHRELHRSTGPSVRTALLAVPFFLLAVSGAPPAPFFEDRTAQSGIGFVLHNSATPERHQIETMAGGVAVFDFDNDGYPDIYLANGAEQPSLKKTGLQYSNRLYRNRHDWTFEDVTATAGVGGVGYNIAVAAGDCDNDGYPNLVVDGG